ncbi:MAG: ATP-binding protein [Anaerolineae bacterium]|nr:ATP-binding protein [Anaerolineae bacterium]
MLHDSDIARPLRIDLVGRKTEMEMIKLALEDYGTTHILVFRGPGGIGKTYLLEAAQKLAQSPGYPTIAVSNLVDLFLSTMHSNAGIEYAIINNLAPESIAQFEQNRRNQPELSFKDGGFREYLVKRAEHERLQKEEIGAGRLERLRKELTEIFIQDFNAFSKKHRVLLAFDTVESIQYEPEVVQSFCRVDQSDQTVAAKDWLLTVLPRLTNTVILVAGRSSYHPDDPPLPLWDDISQTLRAEPRIAFKEKELSALSQDESMDYFNEMIRKARQENLEEIAEQLEAIRETPYAKPRIHRYAQGLPIRLSLLIDFARWGIDIARFFPASPEAELPPQKAWQEIEELIVKGICEFKLSANTLTMLRILVAVQIGLDAGLLHHLTGWPVERCARDIQELTQLCFIKRRESPDAGTMVFLHDEIYDMLFASLTGNPTVEYRRHWQDAAAYYQAQLAKPAKQPAHDIEVALLHYRLRADPVDGYDYYLRMTQNAIYAHHAGYDMALRDERIRFFNNAVFRKYAAGRGLSEDQVARASTAHWIERHIAQGRLDTAQAVIESIMPFAPERIRALIPGELRPALPPADQAPAGQIYAAEDLVFWALLFRGYAQILTFKSRYRGIQSLLQATEAALEAERDRLSKDDAAPDRESWRLLFALGAVREQLGYLHRAAGRYNAALIAYRGSEQQFRRIRTLDIKDYLAQVLTNRAFVQAFAGRPDLAQHAIKEAYDLRREGAGGFRLALTQNTWSRVATYDGHPEQGIRRAQDALATFEDLGDWRGIGLAHNAMGLAYRRYGEQWKLNYCEPKEAQDYYQKALDHLSAAVDIFTNEHQEPLRLWEAYSEMGSTYTDLAFMHLSNAEYFPQEVFDRRVEFYRLAVESFKKALDSLVPGEMGPQRIDTYEDLAQVHADFDHPDEAEAALRAADALVPDEYRLVEGQGFRQIEEPQLVYWASLGKIYQRLGIETVKKAQEIGSEATEEYGALLDQAAREFAFAYAYFRHAWAASEHITQLLRRVDWRTGPLRGRWRRRMRDVVAAFGEQYKVDMAGLERTIWVPAITDTGDALA